MTDLVAGELRGYRQFFLREDGLYPVVHAARGPWNGHLERAACAAPLAEDALPHEAPARGCRCGLYAMYLPGSATVVLGGANAVVSARGRTVLGDRGFRAAAARIEAVTLPASVRLSPRGRRRARRMLADRYPATRVYTSTRRMLRDHPPDDVTALGITPPPDPSRGYRLAAAVVWAGFVVGAYGLVLLPHDAVRSALRAWWPLLLGLFLAWQAALVRLVTLLMAQQAPIRDED